MISEVKWEKAILNAFGIISRRSSKDPQNRGSLLFKMPAISHLGILFPAHPKKSEKKGKSPLENTEKAYIFVGFDYLPKILSMNNLSCANDLEKPYLFKP